MKLKYKDARIVDMYHVMCPHCLHVSWVGDLPIYMARTYGDQLAQCVHCKKSFKIKHEDE